MRDNAKKSLRKLASDKKSIEERQERLNEYKQQVDRLKCKVREKEQLEQEAREKNMMTIDAWKKLGLEIKLLSSEESGDRITDPLPDGKYEIRLSQLRDFPGRVFKLTINIDANGFHVLEADSAFFSVADVAHIEKSAARKFRILICLLRGHIMTSKQSSV